MTEAEIRALRADATRNRDQLLTVATREAGVGIATLYGHFPTKESLVDAVDRSQVVRLTTGARELLDQLPPAVATTIRRSGKYAESGWCISAGR